jgi:hypothetical protein
MTVCQQMELDFFRKSTSPFTTIAVIKQAERIKEEPVNVIEVIKNIKKDYSGNISLEDKNYCSNHFKAFQNALNYYNCLIQAIDQNGFVPLNDIFDGHDPYCPSKYDMHSRQKLEDAKTSVINRFVDNIIHYFNQEYHLKINTPDKRLYHEKVTSHELTEYIINQLNGKSLIQVKEEQYKNELKQKMSGTHTKVSNTEIQNRKIFISPFLYLKHFHISFNGSVDLTNRTDDYSQLDALNHCLSFFTGKTVKHFELWGKYESLTDFYQRHIIGKKENNNKVLSIKFYKNGKAEIEFDSNQTANDFLTFVGFNIHAYT